MDEFPVVGVHIDFIQVTSQHNRVAHLTATQGTDVVLVVHVNLLAHHLDTCLQAGLVQLRRGLKVFVVSIHDLLHPVWIIAKALDFAYDDLIAFQGVLPLLLRQAVWQRLADDGEGCWTSWKVEATLTSTTLCAGASVPVDVDLKDNSGHFLPNSRRMD